ncbi:aminotransferase class V-fold PLP-dependent enzyme [Nonomuraea sp. NPDC046570]|uniref:aminotransferase class V-fold PLP-dependent enzyme n=1 Tax=Nonomuraea sp. NPDC046570 TaxID=3155255 RepID=UPI00340CE2E1
MRQFREPPGYLDFARVGPTSEAVTRAVVEAAELLTRDPCAALDGLQAQAAKTQAAAADLLRSAVHEVAFVSSTSHALFAAAAAMGGRGGVVLVPRGEFPSNIYPWLRFEERGGLRVRWIDAPRITPETVRAHLDQDVRALTISAVDAFTGYRAPLGALKETLGEGRTLIVDAIQGLGAVPLEVEAADVLACGGQKWLRAGWGAAILLVRDRVADRLTPGLGGWSGVHEPLTSGVRVPGVREPLAVRHPKPPLTGAVAHTPTNPDYPAVAALGAAIDLALSVGVPNLGRQLTQTLATLLDAAMSAGAEILMDGRDPETRSGIACLRLPGRDPAHVHAALGAAGLTTTLRGGWIRLSPHATTPGEAVDRLAHGLRTALTPRKEALR